MRELIGIGLLLLLGASPVWAQSLGSVAKKERERREKNKAEGVSVQEFTEEEVFGPADEESSEDAELDLDSPSGAMSELEDEAGTETNTSSGEDWERESRERRRSESEWRARVQRARLRIDRAKQQREALNGLNLSVGEHYVDAQGRTVIQSLEHLQRLVREADEEVAAAEAALAEVLEDARRAGVPRGWVR